jgi:hypothetical protein
MYSFLYSRFLRGNDSLFRRLLWTALAFNCGTWIAGGPMHLFNSGIITMGLLGLAYSLVVPRQPAAVTGRAQAGKIIAVTAKIGGREFSGGRT